MNQLLGFLKSVNAISIFRHEVDEDIDLNTVLGRSCSRPKSDFYRCIFYLKAICDEPDRVQIPGGSYPTFGSGKKGTKKTAFYGNRNKAVKI
jgi:hypothetical protein